MSDYLARTGLWWAIAATSLTAAWILARWDEHRQTTKKGPRR